MGLKALFSSSRRSLHRVFNSPQAWAFFESRPGVGKWDQALAATAEAASLSERIGDKTTAPSEAEERRALRFRV